MITPCLEHNQKGTAGGYGKTTRKVNGKWVAISLHRLAYERTYGSIPPGLDVRHKCDNRRCINPEHLELGTRADNLRDMAERGRSTAKLTYEQVQEIRKRYVFRCPVNGGKPLAEEYGVTPAAISAIVLNKVRNIPTLEK